MAEYRYYLIPDAMTRAFPEQFEKQTPTEFFDNIADLEKRYHQLREMPYNNERTWNERTRFPYARLVVGVDRQNPDGAVAIIQVRNGISYLCDDYRGPYADGSDAQIPQMAKKLVEVIGVDRVRPHTYTQRDGYTWVQVEKDMHITEWLYAHELCSSLQFTRFLNRDGRELFQVRDVLLANYEKYLKGNEVFQVNVEQTEAVETTEKEKQVFPLHGLVALFLFLIIYVEYGRRFDAGSGKPYLALPAPLGEGFQMMGLLAAGTVPAVAGLVLLLCSGESRGLLREISAMILLLAACIVWIWIVGKWIQNLTSFTSHMFLLVLINLVFCPVLVDIAAFIPALKFVRYLCPVGIYLEFISL